MKRRASGVHSLVNEFLDMVMQGKAKHATFSGCTSGVRDSFGQASMQNLLSLTERLLEIPEYLVPNLF